MTNTKKLKEPPPSYYLVEICITNEDGTTQDNFLDYLIKNLGLFTRRIKIISSQPPHDHFAFKYQSLISFLDLNNELIPYLKKYYVNSHGISEFILSFKQIVGHIPEYDLIEEKPNQLEDLYETG